MGKNALTLTRYIELNGLTVALVAQKMGVSRQAVDKVGKRSSPTVNTLLNVSNAMTELGVPTTVADLCAALQLV